MAVKGLSSSRTYLFVSLTDPCRDDKGNPTDGATVFELGTLDGTLMARIKDLQADSKIRELEAGMQSVDVVMTLHAAAMEACRVGIRGWSNFLDEDGKEIKFEARNEVIGRKQYHVLTSEAVGRIPPDLAMEIMQSLVQTNSISKEDEGK
jgi:hypothetical protein